MSKPRVCRRCSLHKTCRGPVWGFGDPQARLWWVGEAPGRLEDIKGIPFIGKAGDESANYKARYGIRTVPQYTTNTVKCRPPKNRDPKPDEIEACDYHLSHERRNIPRDAVVATLGRFASAAILGQEVAMDMVHAIPQRHESGYIVVPVYHPAVGLYEGRMMTQINEGYKAVADAYNGIIKPEDWTDPFPKPQYRVLDAKTAQRWGLRGRTVAIDCERIGNILWSIQISMEPGTGWFIWANDHATIRWLRHLLGRKDTLTIIQNAQHDLPLLAQVGIRPKKWIDTMLVANLLCDVPRGLKALAYRLCGMQMQSYMDLVSPYNDGKLLPYLQDVAAIEWPDPEPVLEIKGGKKRWKQPQPIHTRVKRILSDHEKGKGKGPYERWMNQPKPMREMVEDFLGPFRVANLSDIPFEDALYYAARDPDATLRVFPKLWARLTAYGLEGALELDQGIVEMLARMEEVGVKVDSERLEIVGQKMEDTKEKCLNTLKKHAGYWVNPGSTDQVGHLLYRKLRISPPKRKVEQTKPSTNKDYLEKIKDMHPAIPAILDYRAADKLKGSFSDRLLRMRDKEDRIHDDLSQIRTTSGRLTASILLLVPQRGELAPLLRECFIAGTDCVFLMADYSQIELRVLADLSKDKNMLQVYRDNGDIHTQTACNIFGLTVDKVDKMKHRYPSKTVNFLIPYGGGAGKLHEELGRYGWSPEDCEKFIDDWYRVYPGVRDLMNRIHQDARRKGFVVTRSGRRRLIPEVRSVHPWIRNRGLREAGNHPIQGIANEIMKRAMILCWHQYNNYWKHDFYIEPIIQVHDDLKWELLAEKVDYVAPLIRNIMESCGGLCIPTPVDMEVGLNWKDMEGL